MSEIEGEDEEVVMVAGVMFEDVCVCVCAHACLSKVQVLLQCQRKRQAQSGVG